MKRIKSTTLICCSLLGFAMLFISCEKKETVSSAVELLSFGPSGAAHGERIRFIGNNLDKVTAIDLVGASVPSSAFVEHTRELIVITVPLDAERGQVTLKTPSGDVVSKSPLNLDVPVQISSITETVKPGETITIKGEYLNWISAVTFEGDAVVETFENQSRTELVVRVPLEAKTGFLIFSCGGTEPIELESETELTVMLPVISGLQPLPVRHGSDLTINGQNLDLVKGIVFTGLSEAVTEFVSQSETALVVTVPNGVNNGKISVISFSEVSVESGIALTVVLPKVTGYSANPVERGKTLTLNGTDLNLVREVWFKGTTVAVTSFVNQSEQQLTLVVPEAATRGTLDIVASSDITVSTPDILTFVGDPEPLAPLRFPLYVDKLENSAQNWGWGSTASFNSVENVRDGEAAIKVDFTGAWGALKFANFSVNTSTYTELSFAVFATPEAGGKKINVSVNGGTTNSITLEAGKWVEHKISMANLGNPTTISEVIIQEAGWTGSIFIDHVGLR